MSGESLPSIFNIIKVLTVSVSDSRELQGLEHRFNEYGILLTKIVTYGYNSRAGRRYPATVVYVVAVHRNKTREFNQMLAHQQLNGKRIQIQTLN